MPIEFTIPGVAVGKASPRVGKHGTYYPKATKEWLHFVRDLASRVAPPEPWTCPVELDIMVSIEPPASWSSLKRNLALAGSIRPTSRPDVDNYAKGVSDGCNGVIWVDDAQVVELHVSKTFRSTAETHVTVRPIGSTSTQMTFAKARVDLDARKTEGLKALEDLLISIGATDDARRDPIGAAKNILEAYAATGPWPGKPARVR